MTTEMGSMREVPGGVELRYERWMKHSPAKVWRALTQNDGLQAWFPTSIEGEWVVGGRLHFVFHGQHADSQPADVQALDESQYWGEVFE
ncbi:MAG: toxin-antitoxin system toxin subunit, partial [Ilumatobacteraceae bacterium]|nr:toxin-antitoxin system toxin subunit [Ilumatobacteraceae bacterium]